MKKLKLILLVLLFFGEVANAAPSTIPLEPKQPGEAWLALTCRGAVTPSSVWPTEFADVVKFHIQVDPAKPRPSLKEMSTQAQYMPKFEQMTKYCTDQRLKMVQKNVPAGETFLDWGTETGYSRFVQGEVFIPSGTGCRAVGQPCARNSQCCGFSNPIMSRTSCNLNTNTCVKLVTEATEVNDTVKSSH